MDQDDKHKIKNIVGSAELSFPRKQMDIKPLFSEQGISKSSNHL